MENAPRRRTRWSFLGRLPYGPALALQHAVRDGIRDRKRGPGAATAGPRVDPPGDEEHLLLLEHDPVFTLGRNASPADVLAPPAWLAAHGVAVVECDRGGQVTYHGPGQLVGYPILDLDPDRRDVRRYVRDLQQVLIRTLAEYGIVAEGGGDAAHIGVWAEGRKVASIGVHLSRWITTHGFALNVTREPLEMFRRIVPCGLPDVTMGSIASLLGGGDAAPGVADVAAVAARHFAEVFDRELVGVDAAPLRALAAERDGAAAEPLPASAS